MSAQLSFRDPDGFVFRSDGRLFRYVLPHAAEGFRSFLTSSVAAEWMSAGTLARTAPVENVPIPAEISPHDPAAVFEHEAVRFPNYSYEWSPAMLFSAAELTIHHARGALGAGFELKDATPLNVMFDGATPVFIDVLSFSKLTGSDGLWRPFAQFVRTFVYPLLASRYFGLAPGEILLAHRDGLTPQKFARMCSPFRLAFPPFLGAVTIPLLMSRRQDKAPPERYSRGPARDPEEAAFLLNRTFGRAERLLHSARPRLRASEGVHYMRSGHTYEEPELQSKAFGVSNALRRFRARRVLDVGCNTGHFSRLAASHGAFVVALDRDADVVDALWASASEGHLDILPLLINIARPPGGVGWANREKPAFLERARGYFDCILMLALIHHLLVSERIPLDRIVDLAAELTTKGAVIEYVDPTDWQFQRIARGRDRLHTGLTRETFESQARRRFEIVESREVTPTRRIYILEKKPD